MVIIKPWASTLPGEAMRGLSRGVAGSDLCLDSIALALLILTIIVRQEFSSYFVQFTHINSFNSCGSLGGKCHLLYLLTNVKIVSA